MKSSPHAATHEANLWAGPDSAGMKRVRIVKDRWAARRVMRKVKRWMNDHQAPNADGEPEKFCGLNAGSFAIAGTELLNFGRRVRTDAKFLNGITFGG